MSASAAKKRTYGTINLASLVEAKRQQDRASRLSHATDIRTTKTLIQSDEPSAEQTQAQNPKPSRLRLKKISGLKLFHPISIGALSGLLAAIYLTIVPIPAGIGAQASQSGSNHNQSSHTTLAAAAAGLVSKPAPTNRLVIPSLGVNAPIITVGTVNGAMGTPKTLWQVGIFSGGASFGQVGTSVIVGHSGAPGQHGVFRDLNELKVGDTITENLVNGHSYSYQVTTSAAYNASDPSSAQHLFAQTTTPTLNLVSCTGTWQSSDQQYTQRWIVTSKLVSSN